MRAAAVTALMAGLGNNKGSFAKRGLGYFSAVAMESIRRVLFVVTSIANSVQVAMLK